MWRAAAFRAQIEKSLNQTLAAELSDPRLDAIESLEVPANPEGGALLVVVRIMAGADDEACADLRTALRGTEGLFRSRVAAAIHRKRTPPLTWVVLKPGEAQREEP